MSGSLKGSAVIRISPQGESCERGLLSVKRNADRFADVHLVQLASNPDTEYYPGYNKHLQELEANGVHVVRHSVFNEQLLETLLLVEVPPDCDATTGAFDTLFNTLLASPSLNEIAVSSQLSIEPASAPPAKILEALLFYGFLLVLLVFDTLRSAARLGRYSRSCDLRARRLSRVYPAHVRLPPDRWYMWWFFTGVARTRRGDATCVQVPPDEGASLVMRTIKEHRHLTWWGVWWAGFWLYYFVGALPWWNGVLSGWGLYFTRDISALYWSVTYVLHTLFAGILVWIYVDEYPYYLLVPHVLLYTVFLTLFPAMWFLCKIWPVKSARKPQKTE